MRNVSTLFLLASTIGYGGILSQTSKDQIGRVPTKEELRKWGSPVLPDGTGLPTGTGSAIHGEVVFAAKCAGCHGAKGEGRDPVGPQLVGGIGTLGSSNPVLTIGSYWPYTTTVWDYIHRAMPYYPHPGTLSIEETYSTTAYILYLNGIIAKDEVMNQQTLPKVKMPNRDGFVPDPRPDVGIRNHPPAS